MKHTFVVMIIAGARLTWGQEPAALKARELFYSPPPAAGATTLSPVAGPAKPQPAPIAAPAPNKKLTKQSAAQPANPKQNPIAEAPLKTPQAVPSSHAGIENVAEKPPEAVPLGLRYSVRKRNAAGIFEEVNVDSTFHSGDRIRLEVESNSTGYLYVVTQGSSGNWQVLFPSQEVAGGSNLVHRGESRQVPSGGRGQFVFDEQAGSEKLFVVLSRQPEDNLEKLIYSMRAPAKDKAQPARVMMAQSSVSDDVIARIRGEMSARDLVFEKVENETVAQENSGPVRVETAAYVVNPSTAPDARLVVDLKLAHR